LRGIDLGGRARQADFDPAGGGRWAGAVVAGGAIVFIDAASGRCGGWLGHGARRVDEG
jgi:hypothetical protein